MSRIFFLLPFALPLYVVRFQIGPIPTTLLEIVILALGAWWIAARGWNGMRDAWTRSAPWRLPAALWLIAGFVGVVVSGVNNFGWISALGLLRAYFIEPLLIFWMGLDLIRTEKDREQLWRSFGIATMLLAIYAIIQMLTGWGIPHPWDALPGRRATGPFPFPNALALFVTPVAALAGARVIAEFDAWNTGRRRASPLHLDLAVLVAGLIAIVCAQSDGGLVALVAATFVALVMHKKTRVLGIGLAALGLILIAVITPIRNHVTQIVFLKDWSGMVRTVIWKETTTMLKDYPLWGAGLGAYPQAILPYHGATWMEVFQYPHNILLNLWSEVGVLGIIAFGWIIAAWVRMKNHAIILPVVAAILVHGLVDVPYFKNDLAVAFWLLILLTSIYEQKTSR